MDPVQLWNAIKEELRATIAQTFSYANYVETLTPVAVMENENNTLTLQLATNHEQVAEEWQDTNSSYNQAFIQAAMIATNKLNGTPTFVIPSVTFLKPQPTSLFEETPTAPAAEPQSNVEISASDFVTQSILNPEFRFETFVSSDENGEAYAVAQAVADNPGTQWNPLLIYGGVGLGKTHLMQAIGNKVLERNPSAKVKFITTEDFINDFTDALRRGANATEAFKQEYRSADLLLVDDIQFLADKDKIQEEFFHTFNAITRENHQIVLTSDKLPKEIPGLEMRLVTRFAQGYSANITKPDLPTRVAILRNKAEQENLNIPNDVIDEIAAAVDTNVRDLEGVFNQVAGKLRFATAPVTVETARDILETMNFKRQRAITIPIIQETVAKFFNVTVQDLNGKKRNKEIVVPRQIAMYIARELTQDSLPQIGRAFGGKDHTTVMHSTEKIENAIENDAVLAGQVQQIREELSN
ncbi:chromosomal replication initiator protein DnaA [Weissella confusa]|jgi:chromosomal replication initiator protein DnaA|uniref:chromosomal replication initiator protein DnaA n=1 Tax=Weissella confusa TaxID=1583 RepID=UPI0007048EAA|nr:chromosomal replication initiator protein DnaA [Weissella confusa]KRN24410.1 chromosomal replication initiation protein [Weissella confusa]MBD1490767.1 chromosomal replication initiator protein DnaA [Weissella confusa]MBD5833291.1 chromosomal replication initiator protein DnaA [Weissella confusa]MBJ7628541.1 chromosomal replication initiator protein DnaA [Weissella confusa]MBJ7630651.1 chromosomal replication initiator protein DnaA [Weissella confusa]